MAEEVLALGIRMQTAGETDQLMTNCPIEGLAISLHLSGSSSFVKPRFSRAAAISVAIVFVIVVVDNTECSPMWWMVRTERTVTSHQVYAAVTR
jgi:hypothetical protein